MPLPTDGCIGVNPRSFSVFLSVCIVTLSVLFVLWSRNEVGTREREIDREREGRVAVERETEADRWESWGERDGERETEAHSTLPR